MTQDRKKFLWYIPIYRATEATLHITMVAPYIAMKFDCCTGSIIADAPVKLQKNTIILVTNLAASRLHDNRRKDICGLVML